MLPAGCGFFLSAKDTFQRPPATRWTGIFQNFFCLSNPGTVVLATGGAENFSFHSPHHRVLKFAKRGRQLFSGFIYLLRVTLRFCQMDNKKSSKSFSDLLLLLAAGGGWYLVFNSFSIRQTGSCLRVLIRQLALLRPFLRSL